MPTFFLILVLLLLSFTPLHLTYTPNHTHNRRILHQPFSPLNSTSSSSPPTEPPKPKLPFSSSTNKPPFFPSYPSPPLPPPTPPSPSSLATFPANISSLILPQSSSSRKPVSGKLVAIAVILSLLSALIIAAFAYLVYRRRRFNFANTKTSRSDSLRLFPANSTLSDDHHKVRNLSRTSSEFLYLGTLVNSHGIDGEAGSGSAAAAAAALPYRKLDSPELRPLPPLSRQSFRKNYGNAEVGCSSGEEEEFYSPRGSSAGKESPVDSGSSSRRMFLAVGSENFGSRSSNSRTPSYPSSNSSSPSPSNSSSSRSLKLKSPFSLPNLPPKIKPPTPSLPSSPPERDLNKKSHSPLRISGVSDQNKPSPERISNAPPQPPPPPPPPPPPLRSCETPISKPPVLVTPPRPVVFQNLSTVSPAELPQNSETVERNEETPKPKLKPLHWDKVRASSDRAMVWDQLKSSSFQLNEEMIESLFVVNASNLTPKETARRSYLPSPNQENWILDQKKAQNIAILLRALNVTLEEVCEALLEGNTDTLGTDLLESLSRMAPSKEEEFKLKEYKNDSPFKLGPAERFLKAMVDIPFAFKRMDAMLYIANFDSEVVYLRKSFEILEAACEELRNSRMFLKLLEAVLMTGNRMNVGTNRGDAHAFKLDTLLKLVHVKGTDGKTTLLHFVVQEIIRSEGSRLSIPTQSPSDGKTQLSTFRDDTECRKHGLQVVAGISGELTNVKKAAAMDSEVLSSDISKLARGIGKVGEVVRLNEAMGLKGSSQRFSESMNGFLKKAEEEIIRIQAQESVAISLVKEITEYFHGNSAKEEAHPFRIFMVVRDFISTLDQVCKEVGKMNERKIVSSARQFPVPVNPTLPSVFPRFNGRRQYSSSDDESSSPS
ncbi:hypothetical protein HHK36_022000 [Tetracentron sinense]|uniref:Formin-like protein n=1 Tax=Tetracentron sinense TaxID=13715 RepID=A0A834YRC4_TETSI|nr:hypothetical protein HHK36_022000 [Tetracentron sinense]